MTDYTIEAPDGSAIEARPADSPMMARLRKLEGSGDDAVSPAGAIGRFQVWPPTAKEFNVDVSRLKNPDYNERSASRIVTALEKRYPNDPDAVVVAYNGGTGAADRWIKAGRKDSVLKPETQAYIAHSRSLGPVYADEYEIEPPGTAAAPKAPGAAPKKVAPGYVRGGPDVGVHETPDGPLAQADADMRSYAHPYLQDMRKIAARNRGNALASPLDVASGLGDAFQVIASPFAAAAEGAERAGGKMLRQAMGESEVPEGPSDEARRRKVGDLATMFVPVGGAEAAESRAASVAERGAIKVATKGKQMSEGALRAAQRSFEKARMASPQDLHSQSVKALTDHGFNPREMTPGQIKGGEARRTEDAAKSKPNQSRAIRDQEQRSVRELNRTWYDQALKPIGQKFEGANIGAEGVAQVGDKISAVYERALPKAVGKIDPDFQASIAELRAKDTKVLGPYHGALETIIDQHVLPRFQNGVMDGEGFKKVESELGTIAAGYRQKGERLLAEHVDGLRGALRDNIERNSPPGVREEIKAANTSWAIYKRIQSAAARRPASNGIASPMDFLQAVKKLDRSRDKGSFARGDALMQPLAKSGYEVLRNVVADSGTTERLSRNTRGIAGEMIGGAIGSMGHNPVTGAVGAAVGGAADRAVGGVASAAHAALMRHQIEKAARNHLSGSKVPGNYLRAIGRATDARINPRIIGGAVGGANALRTMGAQQ